MSKFKKTHIDTNEYICKFLKGFNFSNNPKFILRLGYISKVFRNILIGLIGLVEMPVLYEKYR